MIQDDKSTALLHQRPIAKFGWMQLRRHLMAKAWITSQGVTVVVDESQPAQSGTGESYARIWTPANAAELPEEYPSLARLPAWVPPGYIMQARAALIYWNMSQESPSALLVEWPNG